MSRRAIIALVFALAAAGLFARLGVWQLHRLGERRAFNARFESRAEGAPVPLDSVGGDTAAGKYRRVLVTGTFDFDHELVITARSRSGAPGVWLVTPLRPRGGGKAILVNRGWVYSPDASAVNLGLWNEPEHAAVEGYLDVIPPRERHDVQSASNPRAFRDLDYTGAAAAIPYPIEPYIIVELAHGERPTGSPVRLTPPVLDDGPHLSYAIQWFTFAAIALYGAGYLIWLERHAAA